MYTLLLNCFLFRPARPSACPTLPRPARWAWRDLGPVWWFQEAVKVPGHLRSPFE
ncbi:hypothetical protein E2C01_081766 [Portunus trituberculatus]|uniref:Uncharacterized protein n=1 Tax=Portunus trituberculatus TaxID=210409 RepID=A0A5B7IZ01_PORTR|nr:hypothetical protein [Portunus trituberculatus]